MSPSSLRKKPSHSHSSAFQGSAASVPLSGLIVNANCYLLAQMQMIGQPKWNFMTSELPLPHKLKKWNKRKMKWGEKGLNGGFLMGKAKLRLIYAAGSPVFPHQPIWQEKWKSNCRAFFDARPQTAIYWRKLIDVYPVRARKHAPSALWSSAPHFATCDLLRRRAEALWILLNTRGLIS